MDMETRSIGFHDAGRFGVKGSEPLCIALSWLDSPYEPWCWDLGSVPLETLLRLFKRAYDDATHVMAHNIRRFDLPIINGSLMEHGMPMLGPKLTIDTLKDLKKIAGMSKSQQNLAETFDLEEEKLPMSDAMWRRAGRLNPKALERARQRCRTDVVQNKALYWKLREGEYLHPPKVWRP